MPGRRRRRDERRLRDGQPGRHQRGGPALPDSGHGTLILSPHPACLLADTTAFIQAGQPGRAAAWAACTGALARELVPFPAP